MINILYLKQEIRSFIILIFFIIVLITAHIHLEELLWATLATELIEAEWRIYESLNYDISGSDNGLSPVRRQAMVDSKHDPLLIVL